MAKRNIIEIDEEKCTGCGQCIIQCAEGALEIIDGKAKLVADRYCDGLGACLGDCPEDALKMIQRDADEFDEEAVEHRLAEQKQAAGESQPHAHHGCPSANVRTFAAASPCACQEANQAQTQTSQGSALGHWPVQIRLVPANAPFLKNADLLVAADCTPVAYPNFHRDFLQGKAVMIGCPKFDDAQSYVEKFADIFKQNSVKSVTVVVMEVPCCAGLPMIVKKGIEMSGKAVPTEKIVISSQGEIIKKEALVA